MFFIFCFFGNLSAEIAVKSFRKLETDMDARVHHPLNDQNGDPSAIIKIVTNQQGFTFDGGSIGIVKTVEKPSEIWVYVPWGIKRISIFHSQLGQLRNYIIPITIEKATVYEMVLITGSVTTIVEETIESQWLVVTPEPAEAMVFINDEFVKEGEYQAKLKPGVYTYRVESPLYHTQAGRIEIGKERISLPVKLKPTHGFLQFTSRPENGAQVIIDGKKQQGVTPFTTEPIASGEHSVQMLKEMYQPWVQKITVADGQTTAVTATLSPNFAELSLTAPAAAKLFVNNQQKGQGSWKGRLSAGIYSVEAQLDKHRTAKQDIELITGDKREINLQPSPIYGSLDVVTTPSGATVTVNGTGYGTTPTTLNRLLIGTYIVELTKPGYATVKKEVSISEGKYALLSETMANGHQVTITSTPSGVNLLIDGTSVGTTPYSENLNFGNHTLKIESGGKNAERKLEVAQKGGETRYELNFAPPVPTVTSRTGRVWMDRNLGASRVSTSSTDEESYGDLYQWGRRTDGHEKRTSQTTSTLSDSDTPGHGKFITTGSSPYNWRTPQNNNLWQGVNGTNNPCPEGFRIPTAAEWDAERTSWISNNSDGAFSSPLKLPVAGGRNSSSGLFGYIGSYGDYWSSTPNGTVAQRLYFRSNNAYTGGYGRASGFSVRCIKD